MKYCLDDQKRGYYFDVINRIKFFYDRLCFFAMILINDFYYEYPQTFEYSGRDINECKKKAFKIIKNLEQEILNVVAEENDIIKEDLEKPILSEKHTTKIKTKKSKKEKEK